MKTTTVVAQTRKGHRVYLEGVHELRPVGQRYNVTYTDTAIHILWCKEGKRKVVASKGGVIDIQGSKVTMWAQGATQATIAATTAQIIIQRVVA